MTLTTIRRIVLLVGAGVALATVAAAGVQEWTPMGPTTAHVFDVAIDPQTPSTVFATTQDGVFRSRDGGDTWERVFEGCGYPSCQVEVDPRNPLTIYFAGRFDFAKSIDGGDSWAVSTLSETVFEECLFADLTVAPQGTTLYAIGLYETRRCGGLIVKSEDAGASWTRVFSSFQSPVFPYARPYSVAVDPSHSLNVYAATAAGVWKSTDGGQSWNETELAGRAAYAVAAEPHFTSVVYAGTDDGIYKSFDEGLSWWFSEGSQLGSPVDLVAISPSDPDVVYAGTRSSGLYRSEDGGSTWTPIAIRAGRRQVEALALDPQDPDIVYAATHGAGLVKSGDSERVWRELKVGGGTGEALRAEVLSMTIDPRFASTFYAGTRNEGVYRSDDEGRTWTTVNLGLNVDEVTALAFVPDGPGTIYAGTPEGFWVSHNGGGAWRPHGGLGAVRGLAADPYVPGCVYAVTDQGLFKSCDSGDHWTKSFGNENLVAFAAAWDAGSPVFYLALSDAIYQSSDRGRTWRWRARGLAGRTLLALAAPPGRTGVAYVATDKGVYKSPDAGRTWSPTALECEHTCYEAELAVDSREPSHVYARHAGWLYESLDAGATWDRVATWPAYSGTLTLHPWSPATLYVGGYELTRPRCDEVALCFDRQRFAVELVWRDRRGRTGLGRMAPATSDDSGVMWFFGEDNWEMLVKVLDGCRVNNRFWVFAAATTDVEYGLRVTDTLSGSVKSYFNPAGNRAAALTDTQAFATCGTAAPSSVAGQLLEPGSLVPVDLKAAPASQSVASGDCAGTEKGLCLQGDRFLVEVSWQDFAGNRGSGTAVSYRSDDSGLMWFFSEDNWEMLVKVLDGCDVNSRFWVFAAATTNVRYTLKVTDTQSGEVRTYHNPLGRAAAALTDASAFATCF